MRGQRDHNPDLHEKTWEFQDSKAEILNFLYILITFDFSQLIKIRDQLEKERERQRLKGEKNQTSETSF